MNWYVVHSSVTDDGMWSLDIEFRRWHPGYWIACVRARLTGGLVEIDTTR